MPFLSVQLLEPKNGLKVLKNALGLFFTSFDFLYQYCLIAILLCLVASFLALRRDCYLKSKLTSGFNVSILLLSADPLVYCFVDPQLLLKMLNRKL